MARIALTVLVAAVISLGVNTSVQAGEHEHQEHARKAAEVAETPQKTCPVMGGKINEDLYTDVKGKRVYVCCKGCIATIEAKPYKYLAVLEKRGEEVADAPNATKEDCATCEGAVCTHPAGMQAADHAAEMDAERAELEPQKRCPIMGGKINKNLYVDAKGRRIYVCCKGCLDKVKANPQKALETLHERGEKAELLHPTLSTRALAVLLRAEVPMELLDARGRVEQVIPGATHLPSGAEKATIEQTVPDKDALIVTYCASPQCPASSKLAGRLRELGYTNVIDYHHGIKGWTAAGLPVDSEGH